MEILRSNYFFAVISYCECVTFRSDNGSRPLRRIHRCCCAIDTEREREKERNKTSRSNSHKLWRASLLRPLCTAFVSFPSNIYISSRLSFYLSFFPSFLAVAETISTSAEREGKAAGEREREGGSTSGSIHTTTTGIALAKAIRKRSQMLRVSSSVMSVKTEDEEKRMRSSRSPKLPMEASSSSLLLHTQRRGGAGSVLLLFLFSPFRCD